MIGEALNIMHRIGCLHCSARYLVDLGLVANVSVEPERVVRLLASADALRDRTGIVVPAAMATKQEKSLTEARRHVGDARFATLWSEGRAMSLAQATAYALGPAAATD